MVFTYHSCDMYMYSDNSLLCFLPNIHCSGPVQEWLLSLNFLFIHCSVQAAATIPTDHLPVKSITCFLSPCVRLQKRPLEAGSSLRLECYVNINKQWWATRGQCQCLLNKNDFWCFWSLKGFWTDVLKMGLQLLEARTNLFVMSPSFSFRLFS